MLPGPVFNFELITTARRPRYYAVRLAYGLILLYFVWQNYESRFGWSPHAHRGRLTIQQMAELVARAGAREALALATGQAVPSTITDARSFRIFFLLQEGMSLGEAERLVAALFKVPAGTARRWVSAHASKKEERGDDADQQPAYERD